MPRIAAGFSLIPFRFRASDNAEPLRLEMAMPDFESSPRPVFETEAHFSAPGKAITIALRINR
jgi:hypothetical protein